MKKTLIGRSKDYVGLALDLRKSKRHKDDTIRQNARRHVAERMGRLRGLPQKIGQMIAMSDDEQRADVFADLGNAATPMPFESTRGILEEAWHAPIESTVNHIEPDGRAASLGQVHRAQLTDGTDVAIKVAYPGIRQAVMSDLKLVGWLSSPVGDLRRGFDLADYRHEIMRDLEEELNYETELSNQQSFGAVATPLEGLVVPEPIVELCRENVLVSRWEEGETIDGATRWPEATRGALGRLILSQFLTLLFDHGVVHGDPNPGNYRFRLGRGAKPEVVLYDYGSVLRVPKHDRLLLLRLIRDTMNMEGSPLSWLVDLGFRADLLSPIERKLPAVCRTLFEPFLHPVKYDLGRWNRKERLDDVLGDDRWNFRMAGPAKLILLMRAFRGVVYYLSKLQAPVSWNLLLKPMLDARASALDALEPAWEGAGGQTGTSGFQTMAKHLRIEVRKHGERRVSLTFPAASVENLEDLMDPDLASRLQQDGRDLDAVARSARASGYAPGELFRLAEEKEQREVRLWLE